MKKRNITNFRLNPSITSRSLSEMRRSYKSKSLNHGIHQQNLDVYVDKLQDITITNKLVSSIAIVSYPNTGQTRHRSK
jgi:hypothetical protein